MDIWDALIGNRFQRRSLEREVGGELSDERSERKAQKRMAAEAKRELEARQAQREGRPPPQF